MRACAALLLIGVLLALGCSPGGTSSPTPDPGSAPASSEQSTRTPASGVPTTVPSVPPTSVSTATATPAAEPEPTTRPTAASTARATATPTSTPTPTPTATPTSTPTPTPTPTPTMTPTPTPTPAATPASTPTTMPPPEAIAAIEALPWVTDGRTEYESYIVGRLQRLSAESQNVFLKLMDKPWLTSNECRSSCPVMIHYVIQMSGADETAAAHILDLEFIETLEYSTAELSLEFLRDVLLTEPVRFWNLLSHQRFDTNIREGRIESVALLYLELEDPDSAAQLEALPWVQDGVDRGEVEWLVRLARLGATSRPFLQAVLAKERVWLPPGPSPHMASLRLLASISAIDAELAIRVMELPFLATIEGHDYDALLLLARTAASDLSFVEEILSHLAVAGTSPEDTPLATILFALGREDPAAREALDALPWIQDGVGKPAQANVIDFRADPSTLEEYIVFELFRIHERSSQLFSVLVSKPWLQDGLNRSEVQVFLRISELAGADAAQTLLIVSMPFLDTVEGFESEMLDQLQTVTGSLRELLNNPELAGGIEDGDGPEVTGIVLALRYPAAAAEIDALPWVQDGVDDLEREQLFALRRLPTIHAPGPVFWALLRKPWVQDGLTGDEPNGRPLFARHGLVRRVRDSEVGRDALSGLRRQCGLPRTGFPPCSTRGPRASLCPTIVPSCPANWHHRPSGTTHCSSATVRWPLNRVGHVARSSADHCRNSEDRPTARR